MRERLLRFLEVRGRYLFPLLLLVPILVAGGCSAEKGAGDPEPALPEVSVDRLERIDGRLFLVGSGGPFTGMMADYYPDGVLKSRSAIESGVLHGVSEGYYPNGQLESRESFVDGVSHGTRVRFYEDGKRRSEAEIVGGEFHGGFRRWHANGSLAEETWYVNGVPEGESVAYFESGFVRARVHLVDGAVTARWNYSDGELSRGALARHR